jgi:histidinol-phosphate/aromatic aminotransferase/cobyric acid decarboxylase-like protein
MLQHGGHEVYTVKSLVEDYSVTTNFMGPSKLGISNMQDNLSSINHYPPTDKNYFSKGLQFLNTKAENIIWGNGASELIDLTIRYLVSKYKYKTYNKGEQVQFMEYERSCKNAGLVLSENELANILIIINPNNPTGRFMKTDELIDLITNKLMNNGTLIIDESMIYWLEDWENYSVMFDRKIKSLLDTKECKLIVVQSWTKIFSCTGIRFGSIWSYDTELINCIEKYQVPWSVNILAYHYLEGCLSDTNYLNETRLQTPILRKKMYDKILELFPFFTIYGEPFLSWLWIDVKSHDLVVKIHKKLFDNGILIRKGEIGYKQHTFIRIAVRSDIQNNILFNLLSEIKNDIFKPSFPFKIDTNIIYGMVYIDDKYLLPHEEYLSDRKNNLQKYLENNDYFILPSIIACSKTLMIIDGHHRFEIYKMKNIKEIPVLLIDYENENILTHLENPLEKNDILMRALNKNYLIPKSTKHLIKDESGEIRPLISISILIDLKHN